MTRSDEADSSFEELSWRFSSSEDGARIVGSEDVARWPPVMVAELERNGLLVEHTPANRVTCPACEMGHVEDVQFSSDAENGLHAIIPCPVFGRAEIEPAALRQWRLRDDELTNYLQREEDHSGFVKVVTWDGTALTVNRDRMASRVTRAQTNPRGESNVEPAYMFRSAGRGWHLAFESSAFVVRDLKGMSLIHSLLVHPNTWVSIIDLVPLAECGLDAVDNETLKEVRRLAANGDASANQLKAFVRSVTGPRGTVKRTGGSATLASNALRMNIRRAIKRIREDNREMADHLDRCVKTGLALSYQSEARLEWAC